jgi:rhodanese-related sulfurtransferase
MTDRFRRTLREALFILGAATVLGFVYTAVTGKGMFATPPPVAPATHTAPEFIAYDQALALFQSGAASFVDARHSYDYGLGHIKGAINLPLKEFESNRNVLGELPKDRLLVTYCDGAECNSSIDLAVRLDSLGYSAVKIFFGGWREWESNGGPVEQ